MRLSTTFMARILFSTPFIIFGGFHFMDSESIAEMVPIPPAYFWVYLTGAALIAAGVAIIFKKLSWLAAISLALMLIIFSLSVHLPGVLHAESDIEMRMSIQHMLKDLALAGGALAFAHIFEDDDGSQ